MCGLHPHTLSARPHPHAHPAWASGESDPTHQSPSGTNPPEFTSEIAVWRSATAVEWQSTTRHQALCQGAVERSRGASESSSVQNPKGNLAEALVSQRIGRERGGSSGVFREARGATAGRTVTRSGLPRSGFVQEILCKLWRIHARRALGRWVAYPLAGALDGANQGDPALRRRPPAPRAEHPAQRSKSSGATLQSSGATIKKLRRNPPKLRHNPPKCRRPSFSA